MPVGATYSIRAVARTTSDADGYYVLRTANTPELRAHADEIGVNLELDVFTPAGRHLVFTDEARFDATSNGWTKPGAKATDKVSADRTAANRRNMQIAQGEGSDTSTDVDVAAPVSARDHDIWPGCSNWRVLPKKDTVNTIATGSVRNGVSLGARYNAAATSEKSTGISYNAGASWSISGTRSRSSNFTASYYVRTAPAGGQLNREYRVGWRHLVSDRHCPNNEIGAYHVQVETSPETATGGGTDIESRYGDFSCPTTATGNTVRANFSSVSTESGTATTYSSAFSFIPTAGAAFVGSSKSGYNSNVLIGYTFNSSNGGYWCGNNNVPTLAGRTKAWK